MSVTSRALSLKVLLLFAPLLLIGAKCIENDSLRRDGNDDWHIYGEIHNETDVQGADIRVIGTLLDAGGNTIATAQTFICPFELSPGSFSGYDIHFEDSSGLAQPASYRVNVLSGKALPGPLPMLEIVATDLAAQREGPIVYFSGGLREIQPFDGHVSGCAAFYDADGKMVQQLAIFGFGLEPGVPPNLNLGLGPVPGEAMTARLWIVGSVEGYGASHTQAFVSDPLPLD